MEYPVHNSVFGKTGSYALAFMLLLATGCSTPYSPPQPPPGYPKPYRAMGQWYQPLPDSKGFRQQGVASWYGLDFHGKKTSSGETYDMNAMTAAHKTLPLGTRVKVTHLETGREIQVRINDRGPFVRNRIIDLSAEAARGIGIYEVGTGPVEIATVSTAGEAGISAGTGTLTPDYFSGNFTIQIGAFS
ncbi:MAG: septal ring lytic transglycosylase RlpA family protein, partial [Thermodesulfobacteriota bacterium]